jgi:transcriptional regulator with XRE-family HTH domain
MAATKGGRRRGADPSPRHCISGQLREIIESRNLSGYAVGQLSGVSPGVVARFLGGQRGLTLDTVDRIAHGLGLRLVEVATRRRPVRNGRTAVVGREVDPIEDEPEGEEAGVEGPADLD